MADILNIILWVVIPVGILALLFYFFLTSDDTTIPTEILTSSPTVIKPTPTVTVTVTPTPSNTAKPSLWEIEWSLMDDKAHKSYCKAYRDQPDALFFYHSQESSKKVYTNIVRKGTQEEYDSFYNQRCKGG